MQELKNKEFKYVKLFVVVSCLLIDLCTSRDLLKIKMLENYNKWRFRVY